MTTAGYQVHITNKSTQTAQTLPRPSCGACHPVVTEYMSYKILYLIRSLQCRPLVNDNISLKNLYLAVFKECEKPDPTSTSGPQSTPKFNHF